MRSTTLSQLALVSGVSATANYLGFNSGALKADNSAKFKADWVDEFTTAQNLEGAPGSFNAVRLYTNIQGYTTTTPIEAFEAAIETNTSMLLGVWASGVTNIDNELTALKAAIKTYGTKFTDLVIGMSIGSEDLYRISASGVANDAGVGAGPDVIVGFIDDYKEAVKGTALASVPIGHVDTWDVWPNATNQPVLDAVDWIGVDEYPYYENGKNNTIKNAGSLFDTAYAAAVAAAGGKPVWVTETGWPTTGPDWDLAVPSVENAKYYWDEVGCRSLFGKTPTFWYNLRDSNSANTMKFAITANLSTTPYFNLTCPTTFETTDSTNSSTSSSASGTATKTTNGTYVATATSAASSGSGSSGSSASTTTSSSSSSSSSVSANAGSSIAASAAVLGGLAFVAGLFALF